MKCSEECKTAPRWTQKQMRGYDVMGNLEAET